MMSEEQNVDEQAEATEEVVEADPIADAILNAGADVTSDPLADQVEEAAEPVTQEEAVEELILGKFKSPEDLAAAYKELEQQFTLTSQQKAELEALMDDDDGYDEDEPAAWGSSWGKPFEGEPQNEDQLASWAEKDPGAAAQWAVANADRVPKDTVEAVWEHWFERKPTEAMAWYTQQQTLQMQQQYEERISELQEQIAPMRDAQTQQMFEGALDGLENQIPDLADYSDKIQAYIDNIPVDQLHLAFFPNGMDTPEKVQAGVKSLYAIVRMQEAPAQMQEQQVPQVSPITQSRQGVADTEPSDYEARINAAILNA
jgi:hypothetical protein